MRMWMVEPSAMCDRHLLGEHAEIHMLAGTVARGRSIKGLVERRLVEPRAMRGRHDELALEMVSRGFRHESPLPHTDLAGLTPGEREATVEVGRSLRDLRQRCERCRQRASGVR